MSAGFEAVPRVVESRTKFREEDDEERLALNIMYDKRVFRGNTHNISNLAKNLTPAQQEDLRVQEEREKKKVEMIKRQLLEFKKKNNKGEETLYDLRPGPPSRIEVDLTFFLIEQGKDQKAEAKTVVAQTDAFIPRPLTPKYVPKKTGIDAETQIEDYDLFYYDDAVAPILNVVVDKTLEQALLEVEEESEIKSLDKFKKEWERKKQQEKDDWIREVKAEKGRLKQKNELLDVMRKKKNMMVETTHKLQRLNIAKAYLQNTFTNSLQYLNDWKYWRNDFDDQLKTDYKEHLLSGIKQILLNEANGKKVCKALCDDKFEEYAKKTQPIKKNHAYSIVQKEKVRMIENKTKRIISFVFYNPFPVRLNEFSNRLRKLFDDKLEEYVNDLDGRINSYIEKIKNDELEEREDEPVQYPISYTTTPFLTFDISSIGRIALATADDPFYSLSLNHQKYFPELIIYNKEGKIIEIINESKAGQETKTNSEFELNCRDAKLKINDDRKASISLMLQKNVQMVLLVIRSKDLSQEKDIKPGQFERAQFRLIDDETNQTIDQARIKDIKITLPTPEGEGDEEQPPPEADVDEDEENQPQNRPQNIIIMGRIALHDDKWIYEQYNYMFREDKHLDFLDTIGKIEVESRDYFKNKELVIKEEEKLLQESREVAAQAAAAKAASKNKKKTSGKPSEDKKKKDDKEEELKDEEAPVILQRPDINYMPGFQQAIEGIYSTIIGPIAFDCREDKFDPKKAKDMVIKKLKDTLGDKAKDWIHGFEFKLGEKNNHDLKRRKQILAYSRDIQKLKVMPIIPPEVPKDEPKDEGEGQEEGEGNENES